jgi:PAS domain S-box-containing protein
MADAVDAKGTVLVLAPTGKDAELAARALTGAGINAETCNRVADMVGRLDDSTNALLIAEEALLPSELSLLLDDLGQQPPWSDLPVIVLTAPGGADRNSLQILEIFGPSANVTLLERPLRAVTLIAAVKVAVRARRRQREVRDLLQQRETVLTSISDAFSALDREWRYIYVNDKVAELAGLPKEEIIGRVIWEIFPDAVGTEFHLRCAHVRKTGQPEHFEAYYKPWDKWLDTRIYPTKEGLVIFRGDVTERKKQEELLHESQRKLKELEERSRLAVEAADVGTFDFYPPSGELRWSERCNELFGLPPDAKVDYETYIGAIHPDDRHIIRETVDGVLKPEGGHRYDIEYRVLGIEDGKERWLSEKGRALLDSQGHATRFIGTILDITEQKTVAIALQRAKQEAEEANRSKDQFLAMLSHELRTPLTPVLMTIAALRRDPEVKDAFRRDLEVLQRNVELEALLIDDLLDLTRIAHGKFELHPEAVDIHTSIEQALSISSPDFTKKNQYVRKRFEALEHHCWADAARLQQAFWNLIKNAVKFTPEGGTVEIRTRNEAPHMVVIEVADNGIGIDPELQPRIFDAFEQGGKSVTSEYGGLGLGLAISKRVVDLHEGSITAQSEGRGQGATFTIKLKAMETSLLEGPEYLLDFDTGAAGPAEILLVEDHEDTARVMRRILESAGYAVGHAGSVSAALDLAERRKFDLVVSDVGLPDGTGLDLMRQLYHTQGLRGIALSGFGTDEDLAASKAAGFAEHLTKPVDWERLRDAIARLILESRNESAAAS